MKIKPYKDLLLLVITDAIENDPELRADVKKAIADLEAAQPPTQKLLPVQPLYRRDTKLHDLAKPLSISARSLDRLTDSPDAPIFRDDKGVAFVNRSEFWRWLNDNFRVKGYSPSLKRPDLLPICDRLFQSGIGLWKSERLAAEFNVSTETINSWRRQGLAFYQFKKGSDSQCSRIVRYCLKDLAYFFNGTSKEAEQEQKSSNQ